jgi:hypothetical protein
MARRWFDSARPRVDTAVSNPRQEGTVWHQQTIEPFLAPKDLVGWMHVLGFFDHVHRNRLYLDRERTTYLELCQADAFPYLFVFAETAAFVGNAVVWFQQDAKVEYHRPGAPKGEHEILAGTLVRGRAVGIVEETAEAAAPAAGIKPSPQATIGCYGIKPSPQATIGC